MNQEHRSLAEAHGAVEIPSGGPFLRRWWAVAGPALMVAVGYMDPGNWATDLAGGSRYNYALIWVLLMSNLMAILLQSLAARLGIANRRDLAQACRETYPAVINIPLYVLAEIAITATDLAEVIGSAIAFQLLFGIPLLWGVVITSLDVLLLLALSSFGIRKLEALVLSFVGTIGIAFLVEIVLAKPEWHGIVQGFVPSMPDSTALYIAIGILGATVMPHNLYLHSSLVQTRRIGQSTDERRQAVKLNTVDSVISLNLAFLVNAAILVMAAAVFYRTGHHGVAEIQDAHRLLEPILGAAIAPIAFAVALLASGQSSTITGTLAGQIVMEGYLNFRVRPWLRRLITRLLAVIPAVLTIVYFGENSTGGLLVLSQVILSLQLPFAVIPLIHLVSDRERMGELSIRPLLKTLAWLVAAIIVVLNVKLVVDEIHGWLHEAGDWAWLIKISAIPLAVVGAALLLYVTLKPLIERLRVVTRVPAATGVHTAAAEPEVRLAATPGYRTIAVALDFSGGEERLLNEALRLAGGADTTLTLLHVVESPVARALGSHAADLETQADTHRLETLCTAVAEAGYEANWRLGLGDPVRELSRLVTEVDAEVLLLGAHGHRGVADIIHGTTADALRHRVAATVVIVPLG
ncbi:MAG: Nramp family divalent metal transporter [Acidobacteria bacterium]|nr:Nramp family divalent metal transporter [Acidobacteriota bacterium]